MQFDARAAKLLPPGEHLTIDDCPGLRLEATQSTKTWTYRYKSPVDGRMRQIKIGEWPAMSQVRAMVAWEDLRQKRDAGEDPSLEKRAARQKAVAEVRQEKQAKQEASFTVRKVCELYFAGHVERNRKPKGIQEVRWMFDNMLGDFADLPAATLTRGQAFDLLNANVDRPVVCKSLRAELGAAWDYCLDAGKLPDTTPNWWRQIMRGRLKSKGKKIEGEFVGTAKRVLSEQEIGELIRWLPNLGKTLADTLTLYLWTGTRGSEIIAMEEKEISEEQDGMWWTIPKGKTKNARHENATDLRVPLIGRADAVVRRRLLIARHGFLFPATGRADGRAMDQSVIQTSVHYYQPYSTTRPHLERPRLPVTHWSPHDLRRTVRTLLASMGCPDEVAEAVLGHMQPGVKGIYNRHSYDKERREWLTRLDQKLEELAAAR